MSRPSLSPARHWRETPLGQLFSPMQRFIESETASGLVLFGATLAALVLANSPLAASYTAILHTEIGVAVGPFELRKSVLNWINDGLMALFFFLVGLELKREALVGELSSPRQALLPALAACGGAVVPAIIYTALNWGKLGASGWGVPMATDIAFALGVLAILGSRVPWSLKIFLTAVAVIDDLLAVLVIALFYTSSLNLLALGIGLGVLALLVVINMLGIRTRTVYAVLGGIVWLALLESGVHATIAGVLVALTVPARNRIDPAAFLARTQTLLDQFRANCPPSDGRMFTDEHQEGSILAIEDACEAVQAPLQKFEHLLQPWIAFAVMPIFALANAGVVLPTQGLSAEALPITVGVVVGLVLGKPIGLIGTTWLVVRLGIAHLPQAVTWPQIVGVGCLAGLGFTMSLFIATLGFEGAALLEAAKLGILAASLTAGLLGYGVLWTVSAPSRSI